MMLNEGRNPVDNSTIIPISAFVAITTASSIVNGQGNGEVSVLGYGMGWARFSYRGHDVSQIVYSQMLALTFFTAR